MNVKLFVSLVLLVLVSSFAAVASADPGDALSPQTATYADGQTRTIPGKSALWFKFEYAGDRRAGVVKLPYRARDLEFYVYTPDEIKRYGWDARPIGRGTLTNKGDDMLVWIGSFIDGGTYYIKVVNPKSDPVAFELTAEGEGVTVKKEELAPVNPTPETVAPIAPTPVENADTPANTTPTNAKQIPGDEQTIPANGTLWFKFQADGGVLTTITLPSGKDLGLQFEIHTAQVLRDWDAKPVGRGTAGYPAPETLVWRSRFQIGGVHYLKVVNTTANPVAFRLTLKQGD